MQLNYEELIALIAEYDSEVKQLKYKMDLKKSALKELKEQAKQKKPVAAPKRRGRPATAKAKTTTSAAPKRRGRPAKAKTETPAAPKRRGRPAKAKPATPAAPKKRGRPAKAKTETPAAPKKRGRPAKAKTATPAAPKKRGRPAKAKTETPVAPKKRGRPAKAKTATPDASKKRGRPAKAKTATPAAPKRRGRPAKAKTGGYKLNPWDEYIINTLKEKGKVMDNTEIVKAAQNSDLRKELKDTKKGVEGKIIRAIHKLVNKRGLLHKVQKEGRGYNYGLPEWSAGKLKVKAEYK